MEVSPTGQGPTPVPTNLNDPVTLFHILINLQTQALELQRQTLDAQRQQLELTREIVQVGRELEEAARTSGASALRSTAGILVRLIAPSFLVSWLISGIVASGNLDIPILLASPTNQTVPLLAYDLYDNGSLSQAAATFCVFIGIIAALLVAVAVIRLVLSLRVRLAQRSALVPVAS